jgi:single-strand DNA-binding protein
MTAPPGTTSERVNIVNEPAITLMGNAAGDAELRVTPSGVSVAKFRMAQTPRVKDGDGFKDGEAIWVSVTAWRDLGEHVANSVKKGARVVVTGRMTHRTWKDDKGNDRLSVEVDADDVGMSLKFADATMTKAPKAGGNGNGGGQSGGNAWGDAKPAGAAQSAAPQAAESPASAW